MKKKYFKFNRRVFRRNLRQSIRAELYKLADVDEYAKDYERGCRDCGWARGEYELRAWETKSGHTEVIATC